MELEFKINGKDPDPHLGIVEGFIQEGINQVSTIELILVSGIELSESACEGYIGSGITLGLGDVIDDFLLWSRFDGTIYELHVLDLVGSEADVFKYHLIIRPKLWDLNFTVRARSYQNKSRPGVVEEVLKEWALLPDLDYKAFYKKEEIYPKHSQLLQNHTSDLVFIQNLLAEAGINYYFRADKNGETPEHLILADGNVFFGVPFKKPIPYNPDSGLVGDYKINSFETHYRASTRTAIATANLGDGSIRAFTAKRDNDQGYIGAFHSFSCEGQEEKVAEHDAMKRAQYFQSNRATYEGRSNHFIIRPGEKLCIGDAEGKPMRDVLMTGVCHRFYQTVESAQTGDNHPEYSNRFWAVHKYAELRPDQTSGRTTARLKRMLTPRQGAVTTCEQGGEVASGSDGKEMAKDYSEKLIAALCNDLAVARGRIGIMEGEVIEDAHLTEKNELICKVKNTKYPEPEGLEVKVALGWLTQHGWLSLLPRKGAIVYFQFMNGSGGQYQAVLVGYRPTDHWKTLDPKGSTASTELKPGAMPELGVNADNAVHRATFSPPNRNRNTLLGEGGVAEVAVIDGGEDTVYLHADNRICAVGDKSVSISTKSLCESAGSKSQQLGSLNRRVTNDQKISIGGNLERYVVGCTSEISKDHILIQSEDGKIDVVAKSTVEISNKEFTKVLLEKDTVIAEVPKGNHVKIDPGFVESKAGAAHLKLINIETAFLKYGGDGFEVDSKHSKMSSDSMAIQILKKNKEIQLNATNITVDGENVTITGRCNVTISSEAQVLIKGGEGTIDVSGGMVKLNS